MRKNLDFFLTLSTDLKMQTRILHKASRIILCFIVFAVAKYFVIILGDCLAASPFICVAAFPH